MIKIYLVGYISLQTENFYGNTTSKILNSKGQNKTQPTVFGKLFSAKHSRYPSAKVEINPNYIFIHSNFYFITARTYKEAKIFTKHLSSVFLKKFNIFLFFGKIHYNFVVF